MIVVCNGYAQSLSRLVDTRPVRYLGELAIAIDGIQENRNGLENIRVAIGTTTWFRLAAINVVKVPLHVTGNDEIEASVIVLIHPSGAGCPARTGNPGAISHVRESSISVVVIESAAAMAGNEQVLVSVVPNSDAGRIAKTCQISFLGDVFKRTVGLLVIDAAPVFRIVLPGDRAFRCWIIKAGAVGKEDIQATVVVVKQGDADPMVSNKYFLEVGEASCLKWMPSFTVTSTSRPGGSRICLGVGPCPARTSSASVQQIAQTTPC